MNFWKRAEKFPPCLVRLLARRRFGPPMTTEEIARAAGMGPYEVEAISHSTTWEDIDLLTMRRFLVACGVDFENRKQMNRIDCYLRSRPTWKYLRVSKYWTTLYEPLVRKWIESVKR